MPFSMPWTKSSGASPTAQAVYTGRPVVLTDRRALDGEPGDGDVIGVDVESVRLGAVGNLDHRARLPGQGHPGGVDRDP